MPSFIPAAGERGSLSFNSGEHSYVDITFRAGTGQGRLTEGIHHGFQTGDGVPSVHVSPLQETKILDTGTEQRSDYQINIRSLD